MKKYIYILFAVCLLTFVSAAEIQFSGEGIDTGRSQNMNIPVAPTNFSVQNVNSSDFWDNLDTPSDITIFCLLTGCTMTGNLIAGNISVDNINSTSGSGINFWDDLVLNSSSKILFNSPTLIHSPTAGKIVINASSEVEFNDASIDMNIDGLDIDSDGDITINPTAPTGKPAYDFVISGGGRVDGDGNDLCLTGGLGFSNDGIVCIGTSCTSTHSLADTNDLLVTGELEVDGIMYTDGWLNAYDGVYIYGGRFWINEDLQAYIGNDHYFIYNTSTSRLELNGTDDWHIFIDTIFEGGIKSTDWSNVTITESQITDLFHKGWFEDVSGWITNTSAIGINVTNITGTGEFQFINPSSEISLIDNTVTLKSIGGLPAARRNIELQSGASIILNASANPGGIMQIILDSKDDLIMNAQDDFILEQGGGSGDTVVITTDKNNVFLSEYMLSLQRENSVISYLEILNKNGADTGFFFGQSNNISEMWAWAKENTAYFNINVRTTGDNFNTIMQIFSGNATVHGDLDVDNNFTGNHIYGDMHFHNDSDGVLNVISSAGVWVNVTGFDGTDTDMSQNFTNGFTFDITHESLVCNVAGRYKGTYFISAGNAGNNQEYQFQLAVNGQRESITDAHRKIGAAGDVGSASGGGSFNCNVGDHIKLMTVNNDGTADLLVHTSTVIIERIGG